MGLMLTGCLSSEPKVSELEQVAAVQREAMRATETGQDGDDEGAGTATWVAIDIDYSEAPAELPAGTIPVELINEGAIEHNVVIEELNDELILEALGGESDSGTVELEPGDYTYYCSIPGHRAAGMEGTMTVTG
jgi:plastocyanin